MKKLFFILLFVLTLSTIVFSQKIEKKSSNQIVELKECVENYCIIVMQVTAISINPLVGIDDGDICYFVEEDGKKKKFKTMVEILNFMYKNGWKFIDTIGEGSTGAAVQYIFEKNK